MNCGELRHEYNNFTAFFKKNFRGSEIARFCLVCYINEEVLNIAKKALHL